MNKNFDEYHEKIVPTNITYNINTIQELADIVNPENVQRLINDLTVWLRTIAVMKQYGAKDFGPLRWTDDGNAELTSIISNTEKTEILFTMKTKLDEK